MPRRNANFRCLMKLLIWNSILSDLTSAEQLSWLLALGAHGDTMAGTLAMGDPPRSPRGLYTGTQATGRVWGAGARLCLKMGRAGSVRGGGVSLSGCQRELDDDIQVVADPGKEGEADQAIEGGCR